MHFTGRIYFDFVTKDVWRVYTMLVRAAQAREVTIDADWRPFLVESEDAVEDPAVRGLAACEAVRREHPDEFLKFTGAMLTMVFQDRDDPGSDKTLMVAARVAGLDGVDVSTIANSGLDPLKEASDAARERGVTAVPTIERHGPPVLIKTTGAANHGDQGLRLELIDRMLDDDGIWSMTKP